MLSGCGGGGGAGGSAPPPTLAPSAAPSPNTTKAPVFTGIPLPSPTGSVAAGPTASPTPAPGPTVVVTPAPGTPGVATATVATAISEPILVFRGVAGAADATFQLPPFASGASVVVGYYGPQRPPGAPSLQSVRRARSLAPGSYRALAYFTVTPSIALTGDWSPQITLVYSGPATTSNPFLAGYNAGDRFGWIFTDAFPQANGATLTYPTSPYLLIWPANATSVFAIVTS